VSFTLWCCQFGGPIRIEVRVLVHVNVYLRTQAVPFIQNAFEGWERRESRVSIARALTGNHLNVNIDDPAACGLAVSL
jgi:hypothetical protein